MVSLELVALAEDPEFFIEPPEGSERTVREGYCVIIGPQRRWAGVCRLRLPSPPEELAQMVGEIRQLVAGVEPVVWNIGSSAMPGGLHDRLRELGLRDPDTPMDAVCAAMALDAEPPAVDGIEVRRIQSLEEHRAGLEIMLAAATWTESAAAAERARAEETFARRTRRGGFQWLAWLGDKPVAYGLADRTSAGLFLAGGSTLPEARGRGCYRALVRARWDEAVRLGIPGLAVQAQYGTSTPILRKLGFTEVAIIHTLQSDPVGSPA
jgi:GNAT superfamily N-acetyltransferase